MDNLTIIIQFHIKYGHVPLLCQERRRSSYLGRTGVASQEAPVGTRSLLGSAVPGIRCCKWISKHIYRAYIYIIIYICVYIIYIYICLYIIYIYICVCVCQLMRVYTHGLYPKNATPSNREDQNLMVDHD